jgi:hypothetical protein
MDAASAASMAYATPFDFLVGDVAAAEVDAARAASAA